MFALAIADGIIPEDRNPAKGLKYRKRARPIRLTPSFEEFRNIVADIRGQRFSADAEDSGDFVEAMGLLGLGQAELANMKREHVRLDAGQIAVFRRKTSQAFAIPIFPQAHALIDKTLQWKEVRRGTFQGQAGTQSDHSMRARRLGTADLSRTEVSGECSSFAASKRALT